MDNLTKAGFTRIRMNLAVFCSAVALCAIAGGASPSDPLARFWRENDGKTVRRLPVDVVPENVFWGFGTRDFPDGMKAFNRMIDESVARSTYNCVTLTLRCNPELGDPETMAAAKTVCEKAHAAGIKVYMDTDPRIARREFLARWPKDMQGIATVVTAVPTNGVAAFTHTFKDATDHMTGGARNSYRPVSARVAAAFAVRRRADGTLDLSKRRPVDVSADVSVQNRRDQGGGGYMDRADAIVKGFDGFDREAAFQALRSSLDTVCVGNEFRIKYGFVPSDLCRESLGKDMEFAIADAAVANAARALGKHEDAIFFDLRSHSYRNYMDPETRFARPRMLDGSWRTPFDPFGHINTDYTEGNAWQYSWLAPHDVDWLVEFYGGREGFEAKLDSLFTAPSSLEEGAAPDISGMIGQYVHGNEPSHHIIYLYTMQGFPWKTADRAREVMSTLYTADRAGLCGNEDVGQMSAWYVLSALGFYQLEPASTRFWFGSPIVNKAEVNVGGRTFTIIARNNSETNKYIQSVKLNGKPYSLPFIDYSDMKAGARLEFEMGAEPALWY